MNNGESHLTAFPSWVSSYPEFGRRIEGLSRSWLMASLDPSDWAEEFWSALIADPGERRS